MTVFVEHSLFFLVLISALAGLLNNTLLLPGLQLVKFTDKVLPCAGQDTNFYHR